MRLRHGGRGGAKRRMRCCIPALIFLPAANASLGRDGQQRIAKLGHYRAQKVQLVVAELVCEGVGNGGDESRQFAWIHKSFTPVPFYVPHGRDGIGPKP